MNNMISPREAAKQLGVQTITIYRWIRIGQIPAYRLPSGYLRIHAADVDALLHKEGDFKCTISKRKNLP